MTQSNQITLIVDNTVKLHENVPVEKVPVKEEPTMDILHKRLLKDTIMEKKYSNFASTLRGNINYGSTYSTNASTIGVREKHKDEVNSMEINPKDYIDGRLEVLEKSMETRLVAQEKLLSEKLEHLHTKIDNTLNIKFSTFKDELVKDKNESRKFILTTVISTVSVAVALLGVITAILISWLS